MKYDRHFVIFSHFLPFYQTNYPKSQNSENMKKTPEDIIILHKSIKYISTKN